MESLRVDIALQIQKPITEVFEAIVRPEHITQYFIAKSSSRMEAGETLTWEFGDFPGPFPVKVLTVKKDHSVSFIWDDTTTVDILLEEQSDKSTVVRLREGNKELTEENIKWLIDNTFGWTNFLDCMKAYLEYGVRLRKGAFDFMSKKQED